MAVTRFERTVTNRGRPGQSWPTLSRAARVHLSLQQSSEAVTASDSSAGEGGGRAKGREEKKGRPAGPPARDGGAFAVCGEPGLWDFCQLLSLMLKKEI